MASTTSVRYTNDTAAGVASFSRSGSAAASTVDSPCPLLLRHPPLKRLQARLRYSHAYAVATHVLAHLENHGDDRHQRSNQRYEHQDTLDVHGDRERASPFRPIVRHVGLACLSAPWRERWRESTGMGCERGGGSAAPGAKSAAARSNQSRCLEDTAFERRRGRGAPFTKTPAAQPSVPPTHECSHRGTECSRPR